MKLVGILINFSESKPLLYNSVRQSHNVKHTLSITALPHQKNTGWLFKTRSFNVISFWEQPYMSFLGVIGELPIVYVCRMCCTARPIHLQAN